MRSLVCGSFFSHCVRLEWDTDDRSFFSQVGSRRSKICTETMILGDAEEEKNGQATHEKEVGVHFCCIRLRSPRAKPDSKNVSPNIKEERGLQKTLKARNT